MGCFASTESSDGLANPQSYGRVPAMPVTYDDRYNCQCVVITQSLRKRNASRERQEQQLSSSGGTREAEAALASKVYHMPGSLKRKRAPAIAGRTHWAEVFLCACSRIAVGLWNGNRHWRLRKIRPKQSIKKGG